MNKILLSILFVAVSFFPAFGQGCNGCGGCGNGTPAEKLIVKTGIEVLRDNGFKQLEGKRIGLLTNPSGVDRNLVSTIDILHNAQNVNLVALFEIGRAHV